MFPLRTIVRAKFFMERWFVRGALLVFQEAHEYQLPPAQVFWKLEASIAKCGETALGIYRAKSSAEQRPTIA